MLKGRLVRLVPLCLTDAQTLYSWINDRELVVHSSAYKPVHYPDHEAWFQSIRDRDDVVIFGIRRNADDTLVGSCQLHSLSAVHQSAELQIRVGVVTAQGAGVGTEACGLLLQHAFLDLNLHRIYLHVFDTNVSAKHLYKKCGFTLEGRLRQAAFVDGQWVDVLVMSILRNEYRAE